MKVAELYIFRRALSLFLAALAWTLAIVWTTQVLTRINLVTDNGQSAATFFQVAALILPTIIPIVVPFALIVAVAQTLSVMNSDSELVVISAAGSSRMTVIKPILILALAAGVFSFIVDNGVEPYARQKNRELIASARADFLSLIIQEGTFRKIEDGLFVQIGERFADGGLGSIFVADSRQPGTDLVYYAKTGAVIDKGKEKVLLMNDGVVHRKAPAGDVSVIRFTSYAFDLSAFATAAQTTLYPKDSVPAQSEPERQDLPAIAGHVPGRTGAAVLGMGLYAGLRDDRPCRRRRCPIASRGAHPSTDHCRLHCIVRALAGFLRRRQSEHQSILQLCCAGRAFCRVGRGRLGDLFQSSHGATGKLG